MKGALNKGLRYIISFFLIVTVNFALPRAMPGDPVLNLVGEDAFLSEATIIELRAELGLDKPWVIQYIEHLRDLFHFDIGYSYHFHAPVADLIYERMFWTLMFVGLSIIIGAVLGTCAGAIAGWEPDTKRSRSMTFTAMAISCTPPYFLALMALFIFSFKLGITPLKGYYTTFTFSSIVQHLMLPVAVMSLFSASRNFMVMRGSVIQEKEQLYALYAKAKGLHNYQVLFKHVFRNASLPIITQVAMDFGFMFSGALFIEIVFSLNGLGTLVYDAILGRDYPVLHGVFLVIALSVMIGNLLADLLYAVADPRVRRNI